MARARERNRVLREIASQKKAVFMRSLVGTVVEAITLQSGGAEFTEALTDNYLKMRISGRHEANRWMAVNIQGVNGEMLLGNSVMGGELGVPTRLDGRDARLSIVTRERTKRINALTGSP